MLTRGAVSHLNGTCFIKIPVRWYKFYSRWLQQRILWKLWRLSRLFRFGCKRLFWFTRPLLMNIAPKRSTTKNFCVTPFLSSIRVSGEMWSITTVVHCITWSTTLYISSNFVTIVYCISSFRPWNKMFL